MSVAVLARLTEELGYPVVDPDNVDAFLAGSEEAVLFFPNDPERYKESADVAVILPELVADLGRPLVPAVVGAPREKELAARFGVTVWPALAFFRQGEHRGTIARVRDWADYKQQIPALLDSRAG
jgi:hydrogenase-1 operon protein HyaE